MATAAECLRGLDEETKGLLSDDELDILISGLLETRSRRMAERQLRGLDEKMGEKAAQILEEHKQWQQAEKLNTLRNAIRRNEILDQADRAFKHNKQPGLGIRARTVGVNTQFGQNLFSADFIRGALEDEYIGMFLNKLINEKLLGSFNRRTEQFERDVIHELLEVQSGRGPKTVNREARRIAEIMHEVDKVKVATENRAGANIQLRKDRITRVSHNIAKMQKSIDDWMDFVRDKIDWELMGVAADEIDGVLRDMYSTLVHGRVSTLRTSGESNNMFSFVTGQADIAKRASASRRIVWKDADAWIAYNNEYGTDRFVETWFSDIRRSAQNTALMRTWGSKPHRMFQEVMQELKNRYGHDPVAAKSLNEAAIFNEFKEITGESMMDQQGKFMGLSLSSMGRWARALTSMGLLAGAGPMALLDVGAGALWLRRMRGGGFPIFESIMASVKGATSADTKRRALLMAKGIEAITGETASRWHSMDQNAGLQAKMIRTFFKLNLLTYITDANERGLGVMVAGELARLPSDFNKLTEGQRRLYEGYGFDERKWALAQQAVVDDKGFKMMLPGEVREITASPVFEGLSPRQIQDLKDDTAASIGAFLHDAVTSSTLQSGARERAVWRRGLPAGTVYGEIARLFGQFKGPPTAVLTRVLGRSALSNGSTTLTKAILKGEGDVVGIAWTIANLTIMGVVVDQLLQVADGKEPRSFDDPQLWIDGFVRGGGGGIYTDFLLFESQRYGRSASASFAGPVPGAVIDQTHKIWSKAIRGENPSNDMLRFIQQMTPDTFYTAAALDYLIFFQLQEMINPGYLDRMERGVKSDQGSKFFIPPSKVIPRGGGNRVFEGVR